MSHSHNYNPFNYIYDVDGNYNATAVIKMVNVLMKNTQKEGGGGGDQFWHDSTKDIFLFAHINISIVKFFAFRRPINLHLHY